MAREQKCNKLVGPQMSWFGIIIDDGCVCMLTFNHGGKCKCRHSEDSITTQSEDLFMHKGELLNEKDGTFIIKEAGLYGG